MDNASGHVPVDQRILVKPDPVEEVSKGGIILADTTRDRSKYAATKATLVAVGCNAFRDWGDHARKPMPGERVLFAQYTGAREKGADGEDYIIMNDEDLLTVIEGASE
ncbi:co-chaperone GroES [Phenylobacterium sp. J367]|uniref:co-chaperone GroES n=1 Tax=Phenylobacterium sp. J367 TaxID=2898435 RepID=UPI0021509F3A|nr:co-chaperone GroES [Phenylobacterium sp. J367]MCR5877008.1 co-chaperone GroES [Phenylobacterium sp. J367]